MTERRPHVPSPDRGSPRTMNCPEVCYMRVRLESRGPWLPASISRRCVCTVNGGDDGAEHAWTETCDRWPSLVAEIDGQPMDPVEVWHTRGPIIDELEYATLVFTRSLNGEPE